MSFETSGEVVITGWMAEAIRLLAERAGKDPSDFVLSFFEDRCIAPVPACDSVGRSFLSDGAMHQ